ncbi:GNAT family N-acetyltransferase [Chloroflexota bacterium]
MFDINKMLQSENTFYESFSSKIITDYGINYYNHLNPLSYDSNHAHILHISENPQQSIQDIVEFYQKRQLTPRIYGSFVDKELELLQPSLESSGFTVVIHDNTFLRFPTRQIQQIDSKASARRITQISDDIVELILTDEAAGDWEINVVKTVVKDRRFHFFGLFYLGKCVSIGSINIMDGYTRFDNVKTHINYRRQHFGTRLIDYLVKYHANISNNHLYIWSDNPFAVDLYKKIGFQEIEIDKPCWSAYLT